MTQPTSSPARIAANQANAQLSTGPTTQAGKTVSRANAMKHGLTARVVGLEEIETSPPRLDDLASTIAWYSAQMFRTMAQIDRLARIETYARAEAAHRARTLWQADQQAAAETLGLKLSGRPSWVVSQLMRTPAGCLWLMARWELLEKVAASPEGWDETQNQLAFDLLGIPPELRAGSVSEVISYSYASDGPLLTPFEIAQLTITQLQERFDLILEADAREQGLAQAGLVDLPTAELARLRRYEATLRKYLDTLISQLQFAPPVATPDIVAPPNETNPTPPSAVTSPHETNPAPPAPAAESALANASFPLRNDTKPTETTPITLKDPTDPHLRH